MTKSGLPAGGVAGIGMLPLWGGVGLKKNARRPGKNAGKLVLPSPQFAYGFALGSRVTVWTQVDGKFRDEPDGDSVVFINETSFEAFRGIWLKFSPQIRTEAGTVPGFLRYKVEANLLPRTHWNVDVAYYRDQNRRTDFVTHILMSQLHLYL